MIPSLASFRHQSRNSIFAPHTEQVTFDLSSFEANACSQACQEALDAERICFHQYDAVEAERTKLVFLMGDRAAFNAGRLAAERAIETYREKVSDSLCIGEHNADSVDPGRFESAFTSST